MLKNQTFRLFISSTFSDFTEERRVLQTEVFPEIKEYCKDKKLVFQPIDLRWGVTDEASNDQKTLELCLEEVQTSKLHPYPNFLIMMGDRYGTTILPYLIEEKEFDIICKEIEKDSDKELVKKWYKLDVNHLPASYIIEERKDSKESSDGIDYTNRKNWKPINKQLISILQTAVNKSKLNESIKKKYFASATEAEIIEGIFKYIDKTDFQENLLEDNSYSEKIDSSHVYAYIRNIKSLDNEGLKEKLVDDDAENINSVKKEIRKSLDKENTFEVDVDLEKTSYDEDFNRLAYEYKELSETKINFVSKMREYLKNSIDNFVIELEKDRKNKSPEQITIQEEKFEQQRFKDDKLKLFVGRKKSLKAIKEYIDGDSNKPFVVYGRSGLGKSALMAKAIDNSIDQKKNVVYKFVGSTANLNDSPSLLISILRELWIEEEIRKVPNPKTGEEESEKLEDFYLRVYNHFQNIKDNKVIFIDAIDQLTNEDEFLWLPEELPSNLKIIISALDDETYDDTKYFKSLKTKTSNIYPLEAFEDAEELITSKLEKYKRTITDNQLEYILSQEDSNTPLYLTIAVEEVRHWEATKSDEKKKSNQTLAATQKEIIDEYISNLTKLFHHDETFVKRVFSYLYLADGLSESELLEILNTDKDFISQIAPDTHHKKETKELPIVIWARLHFLIKEFLKLEEKDGHETIKFFHREFNNAISKFEDIKDIHEELIELLKKLIIKYQDEPFDSNRCGKLYIEVIANYHKRYEMVLFPINLESYSYIKQYSESISNIENYFYIKDLFIYTKNRGTYLQKTLHVPPHYLINYFMTEVLEKNFEIDYIESLELLSQCFYENMIGILLAEKLKNICKRNYDKVNIDFETLIKNNNIVISYINSLVTYASVTYHPVASINTFNEAIQLAHNLYFNNHREHLPKNESVNIAKTYIETLIEKCSNEIQFFDNSTAFSVFSISNQDYADNLLRNIIESLESSFFIIEKKLQENINLFKTRYYNILSKAHKRNDDIDKALENSLNAIECIEKLYEDNESSYEDMYALTLNDLGLLYKRKENYIKAIECQEKNVKIREKQYRKYPIYWAKFYLNALGNLISGLVKYGSLEEIIELVKLSKKISKKHQMEDFSEYKYCEKILDKLEYLEKIDLKDDRLEDVLEKLISFGILKHPEFLSLISLSFSHPENKQIFDNYIESKFEELLSIFKSGNFEKSKLIANKLVKVFYPKLLEEKKYQKYFDYAQELLHHQKKVQQYIIHRQTLQQILNNNDESELQKILNINIHFFSLIFESYDKNSDLWWSTYIAYCIDLSFFFNRLSFKESSVFAKEVLNEISNVQNSRINTNEDRAMLGQFEMYTNNINKIIEIAPNLNNSIFDLEVIQNNDFMYSFLKDKYKSEDNNLLNLLSEMFSEIDNNHNLRLKVIGVNCSSEEFDLRSLLEETIDIFNNKFSDVELSNYDKMKSMTQNTQFRNLLIEWLILCANLSQLFYENKKYEAAHEFSNVFIDCCGNVINDNCVKAAEEMVIQIYNNVKDSKKTNHLTISGYADQYLETRKLLLKAIEKNNTQVINLIIDDLDLNFVIDENIDPEDWETPLMKAVQSGNKEIVELLIQNGAKIETIDLEPKGTVLFSALDNHDIEMIELLLKYGANINQKTAWDESLYDYAKEKNLIQIMNIFEKYQ